MDSRLAGMTTRKATSNCPVFGHLWWADAQFDAAKRKFLTFVSISGGNCVLVATLDIGGALAVVLRFRRLMGRSPLV